MSPTLSKEEKIRALLIKQIELEKEEIADIILSSDNNNLEFLYNSWVKRQTSGKINLSDLLKSETKKYEKDKNFKALKIKVNYDFDKFDYQGYIVTDPKPELTMSFMLCLFTGYNDQYGRPDYKHISSSDYGDSIENSIKQLEMAYNAYYNPISADTDIEVTA